MATLLVRAGGGRWVFPPTSTKSYSYAPSYLPTANRPICQLRIRPMLFVSAIQASQIRLTSWQAAW